MTDYVKSTNFTAKDSLPQGDANKVIRGSEFDTEFNAIATAVATKSNTAGPTFTGTATFADITGTGTINFTGATVSNLGSVTTVDINGGTLDNVTIGGTTPGAGTFSSLTATTADINAGTVDNTVIGGTTPAAGTFSSLTATTANIDGGSIDGAVIGGSTPAAISGTTGTFSGAVSGTTGTFSGAVTGSNLNISNWDTAFGWGDHSTEGYLTNVTFSDMDAGAITTSGETFANSDTQIPTNAAVRNWVLTTYPTIVELNDLTANVTWATVPDAYISASSVNQHVSVEKATQSKTYTLNESSTLTLSSSITSGVPVVSVTKEIPQTGVTNNNWDVNSTTENYTRLNSAPATTLNFVGYGISNASYASKSFSVNSQETAPRAVEFKTDGTKMYVVGSTSDTVFQYSLSTAWDVSTASYDSKSFSVASEQTVPDGIRFKPDGTKFYILGDTPDSVHQYSMSTAWDISTASYDSVTFSVGSQTTQAHGIVFKPDGTKFYVCDNTNDSVFQYALSTAWDLSTASYESKSFSVTSQETSPSGLNFNPDGTKMFVIGFGSDAIYQYSLSTAWDVSTASYDSVSFSVATQTGTPYDFTFGDNGTKLYVVEVSSDTVYEYNLTVSAVSLGTGSFASSDVGKTIEANSGVLILTATDGSYSEVTAPTSYDQVASGSWEMYAVVYNTTDGDLELSSFIQGFDVSTASFVTSFSTSTQDTEPHGIAFNTDGTKMFVVGEQGDDVSEYALTTGFDVSTASYSQNFSVSSQDTIPEDIAFNTDGTKMFILGDAGNDVNEYTLTTGFDLSTVSFVDSFSVSGQGTGPRGLAFNDDGTKMYFCDSNNRTVFQYTLTTAFDVSTASYASKSFSMANEDLTPQSIRFNNDGTKLFMTGDTSDNVQEYDLSTAFDVSTMSVSSSFSVASQEDQPKGLAFNADGTKMYVSGRGSDSVNEYTIGTSAIPSGYNAVHTTTSTDSQYWTDINSMTADEAAEDGSIYYAVSTDDRTTWKIAKSTDGERSIVRNNSGTWQYNSNGTYGSTTWSNAATNTELAALQEAMEGASFLGEGYVLDNSPSYDASNFSIATEDGSPVGLAFNSDGTKMFMLGDANDTVYEYDLSTGYDLSTASYSSTSFSVSSQDTLCKDLAFNNDGTKMYVVGNSNDSVFEYDLSTGFDLSTASYGRSFSTSSQETTPEAVTFNDDGTKMFVLGNTGDDVNEYSLSTAFNVTTASFTRNFSVSSQSTTPRDIAFNADGTKMFMINTGTMYQYNLGTGFDLSTASYASISFSLSDVGGNAFAVAFGGSIEGTKMYVVGQTTDSVYQYTTAGTTYTNQMNKNQLDAVPDANHFTLGNDLDLAIIFNLSSGTTVPSSDGVSINFDANSLNQGAVLGTDYNWDFPAADKVRITSLAAQNLKVRII